ncbi:MAG: TSUP family transporter, partial [Rhizobiales bacterium]|nr:TSUP family transporter [Hyphomicrobiales bacterium]
MFELNLSYDIIAILLVAGAFAGFIDALAGGGGLITLPALLLTGMPPISALATNKFQGVFGTLTASITVFRKRIVTIKDVGFIFFASLVGSAIGALLLQFVNVKMLEIMIPIVLVSIALYFLLAPKADDIEREAKVSRRFY